MEYSLVYQILQLPHDSDWPAAQRHYRRLAARYHPDRPDHGSDRSLTDINRAWDELRRYYQQHGQLPLQPVHTPTQTTPFERPATVRTRPRRRWMGMSLAAAIVVFIWLSTSSQHPPSAPMPVLAGTDTQAPSDTDTTAWLAPGDPLGRVIEVLGPPHDSTGERWYYGASWIQFRNGRISDWHSSADDPIPVDILGQPGRDTSQ